MFRELTALERAHVAALVDALTAPYVLQWHLYLSMCFALSSTAVAHVMETMSQRNEK